MLADELRKLNADAELTRLLGRQARITFERRFTLEGAADRWVALLQTLQSGI